MDQNTSAPGAATGMTAAQHHHQQQRHQQLVMQMAHLRTYIEGLPEQEARQTMTANLQNLLRQMYSEQAVLAISHYLLSRNDHQSLLNMLTDPLGVRLKQALTELGVRMRQQEAARQQMQSALRSGALGTPTPHTSSYAVDPTSQALMDALQQWQDNQNTGSSSAPTSTTQPSAAYSSPPRRATMTGEGHAATGLRAVSTASMSPQARTTTGYSSQMLALPQPLRRMLQPRQSQYGIDLRATGSSAMTAHPSAAAGYSSAATIGQQQQRRASANPRSAFPSPVTTGPLTTGVYPPATASGDQQQRRRADQLRTLSGPSSGSGIAQPSDTDDDRSRAMMRAQQLLRTPQIQRQGPANPRSTSMAGMSAQPPAPIMNPAQMAMALQRQQQHRAQQQQQQSLGFQTPPPMLPTTSPWNQGQGHVRNQPSGGQLYFTQPIVGPAPVRPSSVSLSPRQSERARSIQPAISSPARPSPVRQTESPRVVQPAVNPSHTALPLKRQSSDRNDTPPDDEAERPVALKRARPLQQVVDEANLVVSGAAIDDITGAQDEDEVAGWREASPTSRRPLPHVYAVPAVRTELGEDYTFAPPEWAAGPTDSQPSAESPRDPPQWTGGPDERWFPEIDHQGRPVDTPAMTSQTAATLEPLIANQGRPADITEEDWARLCAHAQKNRGNLWDAMREFREARGYQQDPSPHDAGVDDDIRLWRGSGEESLGSDLFRGNPEDDLLS